MVAGVTTSDTFDYEGTTIRLQSLVRNGTTTMRSFTYDAERSSFDAAKEESFGYIDT